MGIVVASHGDLASALISSAEMIIGSQENVAAVCLDPKDNLEACHNALCAAIDQVQTDAGVIVLIDLFGGTPANAAVLGLRERSYPIVAGVNLPMLLEVLMSRQGGLSAKELTEVALQAGQDSIIDVGARFEAQREQAP
jgi:mannose/fructose/sorbose-specific phosphotransferase system IIA component